MISAWYVLECAGFERSSDASKPTALACLSLMGIGGGGGEKGMKLGLRMCRGKGRETVGGDWSRCLVCPWLLFLNANPFCRSSEKTIASSIATSSPSMVFEIVPITAVGSFFFVRLVKMSANISSEMVFGQTSVTEIGLWREKKSEAVTSSIEETFSRRSDMPI